MEYMFCQEWSAEIVESAQMVSAVIMEHRDISIVVKSADGYCLPGKHAATWGVRRK